MLFATLLKGRIHYGTLTIVDAHGKTHRFTGAEAGPSVTVRLTDPKLHSRLLLKPHLAFGEAYMDGTMIIDEGTLPDLMELIGLNMSRIDDHPITRTALKLRTFKRAFMPTNTIGKAHKNVAHHYDLTGELYDLFLDKKERQYSCAYFTEPDQSLEDAQTNKMRLIATKLRLSSGQTVLDIGCGWGGMGLFLAREFDVRVVGVTLSYEQLRWSKDRADAEGLTDKVDFRHQDYRTVTGQFDRIVSVGMLEHVGAAHLSDYFQSVRSLLKEDGIALIHSIGRMEPPGGTNPWLQKYIFPGGYTPALSEVLRAVELSGLYLTDLEILRLHYAMTLAEWYKRFTANRDKAIELFDERFYRMWSFYLAACEMAFKHMNQMVFHAQLTRHQEAVPITRAYTCHMDDETRKRP